MIVTEAEGRFVTQRQDPRLAIIETKLPETAFIGQISGQEDPEAALTLSAPSMSPIQVKKCCARPAEAAQQPGLLQTSINYTACEGTLGKQSKSNLETCKVSRLEGRCHGRGRCSR